MKKIKFSVLMSVYYKEKPEYLKAAIDSVLNQTLQADEIVLVEDGPLTEELYEVIESYKNKYAFFKVVKLEKNMGLGNALNIGLTNCSYDYVARMDTDDICFNDRFEKQIDFLSKNPDVDVVGSNIIEFDDATGLDISLKKVPETHNEILLYSKKRNPLNHMTVIFKKNSVISVGSYADCLYFEDYYLWMRMLSKGFKMYNIQKCLLRARAGLNLSSRRGSVKYIKCIFNFQNKLLNLKSINIIDYFYNITVRSLVSILPNKYRYKLYQKKLRNAKNGD